MKKILFLLLLVPFFGTGQAKVRIGGASTGSVSSGTQYRLAYYANTGSVVSQAGAITASKALVSDANGVPTNATTSTTQLNYLSAATGTTGTTSTNVVFSASPTFTGTPVIPTPFTLGATSVTATGTEINYSVGVTSAIQTQLNTKIDQGERLTAYQLAGSTQKGITLAGDFASLGNAYTSFDNTAVYLMIYVPKAVTLTGVEFILTQAGAYTADQTNQVGLFSISGTTATRIASSTNNGNLWKGTANTLLKEPFSSTVAVSAGIYYIGLLFNNSAQTTNPNFAGSAFGSITSLSFQDFTNGNVLSGRVSTQNSLPSTQTITSIVVSTDRIAAAVY